MTLKKRIRRAVKHAARVLVLAALLPYKVLRLPPSLLPKGLRNFVQFWSVRMMWVYVSSFGRRAYIDQPCVLKDPPTFQPRAEPIDEANRMSEEEIRRFYERGVGGPYRAISEAEMREFSRMLDEELERESKAFGRKTVRDRHLDMPELFELFSRPAIVDRLAQLLGPDLILWRSQVFNQMPGAPPITWHQATTYMLEDYQRPVLEPEDIDHLFQLTVWIAVDEATIENGCMQFLPGTHRGRTRTLTLDGKDGFYAAHFELDRFTDAEVLPMELKPGEFIIFSERTIHGSPGNRSNRRRLGVNFRTVLPSTRIYRDQSQHYAMHLQETWELDRWGVLVLRGQDRYGYNKVVQPPRHEPQAVASGQ